MLLSLVVQGQEMKAKSTVMGVNTNVSIINFTYRVTLNPYYQVNLGSSKLNLGPTFLVGSNVGISNTKSIKMTGILFSYHLVPNDQHRKFIFFFSSDLLLQRIADFWDANAYDNRIGNYANFRYRNLEYLLQHNFGYGFTLNLGKSLFLSKGIGLGYYVSNLHGEELSENSPDIENFDYRGYKNFGFSWQVKLGLGFKF